LASGIVALLLAFAGGGVWSLVGQLLTATMVQVVAAQNVFDFSAIKELMEFSGNLMGFGMVIDWSVNIDKLLGISRWIGSSALGFYSLADKLIGLPLTNVTDITTTVMFPALSTIRGRPTARRLMTFRGMYLFVSFDLKTSRAGGLFYRIISFVR
jgi:hypothetical protein